MPFDSGTKSVELVDQYVHPEAYQEIGDPLPDKLSALIRVALKDLQAVEKDPRYGVNMGFYHTTVFPSVKEAGCVVCFAGAVMSCSLEANPEENVYVSEYPVPIFRKLRALNAVRQGNVTEAMGWLYGDLRCADSTGVAVSIWGYDPASIEKWRHRMPYPYRPVEPYNDDPAKFRHDMEAIAADLEAVGE